MCGIFGYVGKQNNAAQIVFEGLKLLEYRGYDSWGIATKVKSQPFDFAQGGKSKVKTTKEKNGFVVERRVGKIGDRTLSSKVLANSHLAVGHTRWATHGGVSVANAHPHLDCRKQIAVVHNGIIENFQELRKDLIKKGHKFRSQTDTEVVPHLIEENYNAALVKEKSFTSAVRQAFNKLKGLNAIVVAYSPSSKIVAAKTGSPLVVGIGDGELFVASDAPGILKHTRKALFLEDNQMVILGKDIKLISLPKGKEVKPKFQILDWKFNQVEKGGFAHFLLKEIYEQPAVLENIALYYDDSVGKLAALIDKAFGTFMLGCGTASYAALAGTYLFSRIAKKHVNFSIGSEFKYLEDYLTPRSLLIAISQSGETIDVVEPVEAAKKKGCKIAAILNVLGSTLYRQSDYKILLGAGPEKAVVGTKSFIAMIAVLLLCACTLAKMKKKGKLLLKESAKGVRLILREDFVNKIKRLAEDLKKQKHIYVLGRGLSYATALEATLKLKETSCIHAEGFAGGELKHGVIALIENGTPCIIIAPNDETYNDIISNAQEVKVRGAFIIGIGPKDNPVFDRFLPTSDIKDATIIPQVVVAQLLAYYLALARGIADPDKPRNLAKSVTVK